ncbi:MAG TPA: carboxypeptidase M32 [Burkholderiaceae bacterium]|nr:carboxypeptidase M32 [Burkholderiaceae bacterium]
MKSSSFGAASADSAGGTPAYAALARTYERLYRFGHLQSMAQWDQAANMPPKGNAARGMAMAEMATLMHGLRTDEKLRGEIARAEDEPLDDLQRANLREIRRDWVRANALPAALVERRALAASRCEHAWRSQRPANDWAGFLPNLREMFEVGREEAMHLSQASGLAPYDALIDRFEPGMTSQKIDRLFDDVRLWLPGLIARVVAKQAGERVIAAQGPFDLAAQRRLCERAMQVLMFDFEGGRLDVSTHPFSGGVPEDVRLTTRFREDQFLQSLKGTIHETGHGRYEQNLPRDWLGQPVAEARSMGLHESQSLSFEMQLGCHPDFVALLAPLVREAFGAQPAFEADNLQRMLTRVRPGFIRVDADEVTYPAHVILRFELERGLIERRFEVEDIPALWDEHMMKLLGVDTRGNFRDGPMQDVHWPEGLFGYFACYTLGAMYAAQWFAAMRRAAPDLDERIRAGDLAPVFDWLRENIWRQGSRWTTDELARRASGETLNPAHFRAHLEARYLG